MKTQSSLEPLEPRVAPAGLIKVSLIGGVLTLIGDDADNSVALNVPGNGTSVLTPNSGTELDFEGTITSAPLNIPVEAPKLVAKLGAGNDTLNLMGNYRSLSADLGAGNDIVNFNNFAVGGPTRILGRDGTDSIVAMAPSIQRFFGNVTFDLGAGDDNASLNGSETTIGGSFSFLGGAGIDGMTFANGASIAGNLSVSLGTQAGIFSASGFFSSFRVGGKAIVTAANTTDENVTCALTASITSILGGLTFAGGDGNNLVQFQGITKTEIGGGVKIQGGAGQTSVFLSGPTTIADNFSARSIGALSIAHFGFPLSVEGNFAARSGSGLLSFGLTGNVFIGKNIAVGSSSGGGVTINPGVQVAKNISINFGGSTTAVGVSLTGTTTGGSVSVIGGSGNDTMTFDDLRVSGRFTINAGAGNDTINLERVAMPGNPSIFAGRLNINAGAGNDTVGIGFVAMGQIFAFSPVQLSGGAGSDTLSFAANNNLILAGSTTSGFESGS